MVRVSVGPSRFTALVDTGARLSMVAPDVATVLGLTAVGVQTIVGVTGKSESFPTVELPEIGFGNSKLSLSGCRPGRHEAGFANRPHNRG